MNTNKTPSLTILPKGKKINKGAKAPINKQRSRHKQIKCSQFK
jgi:hypothetical protein